MTPAPLILPRGTIKRIHIDKTRIQRKHPGPVITVQTSKGSIKGSEVEIHGTTVIKYTPDKPLSCGAKAYMETRAEVIIHDPETPEDRRA